MLVWTNEDPVIVEPAGHFGGLPSTDIVSFAGRNFAVQRAVVPPQGGGNPHRHDSWAQVFYVVSGELSFDVDGKQFTLNAGQSVLLEPGESHGTINRGDTDTHVLVVTVAQPE
jgi:quercetin dioxygenase-like cupin family protein